MNLAKIYGMAKIAQDLLSVLVPFLETMLKRDINGDGKIGS